MNPNQPNQPKNQPNPNPNPNPAPAPDPNQPKRQHAAEEQRDEIDDAWKRRQDEEEKIRESREAPKPADGGDQKAR